MSVANGTDFSSFEDKELDAFTASFNCPSDGFFDQCYSSEEHTESSNTSNESNFFDELDMGLSDQISFENLTAPKANLPEYRPLHSWRANAWRHHNVVAAPQSQKLVHRMRPDGAAISGVELLSLEGKVQSQKPTLHKVPTPPSTPPGTPGRILERIRPGTPGIPLLGSHRVSKKKSTPNMMRPSSYAAKQDSPSFHEWTERFEQFSLQVPHNNLPLSPPPSAKVSQQEQASRLVMPTDDFKPMSPDSPTNLVQHTSRLRRHARMPSSNGYIPTMQGARHSALWTQSPQMDFSTSSTRPEHDWSSMPSAPLYDQNFAAHSQNQSFMQLGSDFAAQGLMIDCGPFEDIFQDNQPTDHYLAAPFDPFETECAIEDGEEDFASDDSPENGSSVLAAQYHASRSHSPSPPISPPTPSNSRRRTRQPRRKSSTIALPRTPKTPTSHGGAVGFVNFTPSDSRKILGGVAPSGSSKTKARREKEASERRRKLSEAAAKAVMEAGGDVEALRKEGLLI